MLNVLSMALHWCILEPLTDGRGPVHLRFQKLIPIFFHAMGKNVELQEDIGLTAGRLNFDMRTSLYCTLLVSIVILQYYSQPPP